MGRLTPQERYDSENCVRVSLKISRKYDADVVSWLERQENKQGAVKAALKRSIKEKTEMQKYDNNFVKCSFKRNFLQLGLTDRALKAPCGVGSEPIGSMAVFAMTVPGCSGEFFRHHHTDGWNGKIEFRGIESGFRIVFDIQELFPS